MKGQFGEVAAVAGIEILFPVQRVILDCILVGMKGLPILTSMRVCGKYLLVAKAKNHFKYGV